MGMGQGLAGAGRTISKGGWMNTEEPKATVVEAPDAKSAAVDPITAAEPKVLKPTCPGCGADPLVIKRLRYDFPDGVVVEVIFCHNPDCRVAIGAQIVGIEPVKPKR
jgi:hypothetical protein